MEKKIELKIENVLEEKTVGYILKNYLKLSGNAITKLKHNKGIFLNKENVRTNKIVKAEDELLLIFNDNPSESIAPENIPLDILYEDEDVLLVNKPKNMPTHPSKEHETSTLANAVVFYLKNSIFRVITRLDKDTSGVVLIAKNQVAAHKLNNAMRKSEIVKEYIAIVRGVPENACGQIEKPIKRMSDTGIKRCIAPDGKYAKTLYELIKTENGMSHLKINPITGRTHQIRVHLSYIGLPIVGDWLYGTAEEGKLLQLQCRKLEFKHPVTNENITVEINKEES